MVVAITPASRVRVHQALNCQVPDRVPLDIGGMAQSGIHRVAYANLRRYLGLPQVPIDTLNVITQAACLHEDFLERMEVDTRLVYGHWASEHRVKPEATADYRGFTDEWGMGWRMPTEGGLYHDLTVHPIQGDDLTAAIKGYPWPNPAAAWRLDGLRAEAERHHAAGRFVVLMGLCPGILEVGSWLVGIQRFYTELLADPDAIELLLAHMTRMKLTYWQAALAEVGPYVDAVCEADDVAGQNCLLMSADVYRAAVKPHHHRLFEGIRAARPGIKIIFHSCGAVRPLISDFVELGIDALHPIQLSAAGMVPAELKQEFGKRLCFWGGGVDSQRVLPRGTPQEVAAAVRASMQAFGPGGGFVFGTVHIIQADVPPANVMAMWDAYRDSRDYQGSRPAAAFQFRPASRA